MALERFHSKNVKKFHDIIRKGMAFTDLSDHKLKFGKKRPLFRLGMTFLDIYNDSRQMEDLWSNTSPEVMKEEAIRSATTAKLIIVTALSGEKGEVSGSSDHLSFQESEALVAILLASGDFEKASREATKAIEVMQMMHTKSQDLEMQPPIRRLYGRFFYHFAIAKWGNSTARKKFPTNAVRNLFKIASEHFVSDSVLELSGSASHRPMNHRPLLNFTRMVLFSAACSGDEDWFEHVQRKFGLDKSMFGDQLETVDSEL